MSKIQVTKEQLGRHLNEQIGFMLSSAEAFDSGNLAEGKRLAVALRILLHESRQSKSLLGQLGMLDQVFLDSSSPHLAENLLTHTGLLGVVVGTNDPPHHLAKLDLDPDVQTYSTVEFKFWWEETVIIDDLKGSQFTRKDIVRSIADMDGGAHVDSTLDEKYAKIREEPFWQYLNGLPILGVELHSVRQIAHEVLRTLIPDYKRSHPPLPTGSFITNVILTGPYDTDQVGGP